MVGELVLVDVEVYKYVMMRRMILIQGYQGGHITNSEVGDAVWKNFFQGKLTYLHWNKGLEMVPTIAEEGGTLLVRKLPAPNPT